MMKVNCENESESESFSNSSSAVERRGGTALFCLQMQLLKKCYESHGDFFLSDTLLDSESAVLCIRFPEQFFFRCARISCYLQIQVYSKCCESESENENARLPQEMNCDSESENDKITYQVNCESESENYNNTL